MTDKESNISKSEGEKLHTLKKPLPQGILASETHAEYMQKLNEAREEELKRGHPGTPGQIKP